MSSGKLLNRAGLGFLLVNVSAVVGLGFLLVNISTVMPPSVFMRLAEVTRVLCLVQGLARCIHSVKINL